MKPNKLYLYSFQELNRRRNKVLQPELFSCKENILYHSIITELIKRQKIIITFIQNINLN
jgi:hypothetical protein